MYSWSRRAGREGVMLKLKLESSSASSLIQSIDVMSRILVLPSSAWVPTFPVSSVRPMADVAIAFLSCEMMDIFLFLSPLWYIAMILFQSFVSSLSKQYSVLKRSQSSFCMAFSWFSFFKVMATLIPAILFVRLDFILLLGFASESVTFVRFFLKSCLTKYALTAPPWKTLSAITLLKILDGSSLTGRIELLISRLLIELAIAAAKSCLLISAFLYFSFIWINHNRTSPSSSNVGIVCWPKLFCTNCVWFFILSSLTFLICKLWSCISRNNIFVSLRNLVTVIFLLLYEIVISSPYFSM